VNRENNASHGLLEKDYGNQSMGFSVDIIIARDGTYWDIATDNGGMAMPSNGGPSGPDPELAARWSYPTAELAQVDEGGGGLPGSPTPPNVIADNTEILEKLDQILEVLKEADTQQASDTAAIIARSDFNTERIIDRINTVVENAEDSGKKLLVLWMAARGETPPDGGDGGGGGEEEPPTQMLLLLLKLLGALQPDKKG
jgi:hypothetical protein